MSMVGVLKDYNCVIEYHPGNVNVVAHALSMKEIIDLRVMFINLRVMDNGCLLVELHLNPTLMEEIKAKKTLYVTLLPQGVSISVISDLDPRGYVTGYVIELRGSWEDHLPLAEFAYNNNYQSNIQMALYEAFYGHRCRTPLCLTELSEQKVLGPQLAQETENVMALYAFYGHRCRTPLCLTELSEQKVLGPQLAQETENVVRMIQNHLKSSFDHQNSYTDLKRKEIEYEVGEQVFFKVSPWKKVLRFGKKRKLSPRFIRPYHILKRVGHVAYQLELPQELERIHDVFHVSMLHRYMSDLSHIVSLEEIDVRKNLTFEEQVMIIRRDEKVLRKRWIPLVKVFLEESRFERNDLGT
ncbi:uncharacterized protein LOC120176219 [Hibiscus syriacus]|uniref:uncharacterized protein LOC120176219 n=1 Tax=Hibiscus syriacus TaxID=106335 RepID=UPI001923EED8|nr:uncharacterized protein LOC120176219 [Hibiscus syriacus]